MNPDPHPVASSRRLAATLLLAFVVLAADQITKHAVRSAFVHGESRAVITSFFDLTYVRNTGAVWGSLQNQNEWLAILSLAVLLLAAFSHKYLSGGRMVFAAALGLIMGGITGNLVDRVKLGWVTDFLDFYWRGLHWPAFNIADAAICTGVGLYLLASFWPVITRKAGPADPA